MIAFVCHPYHRGGVTSWMVDAYSELQMSGESCFITVNPAKRFFGGNRPLIHEMISKQNKKGLFVVDADVDFELGTIEFRALVYIRLIRKNVPKGSTLISSDDEACWMACAALADEYKNICVLHADDEAYFIKLKKYYPYIAGYVAVSQRIQDKAKLLVANTEIPARVIPCGINLENYNPSAPKKNNILWVGRIEEYQKRVSDISKIALALNSLGVHYSITILGTGSEYEMVRKEIENNNLQNQVFLLGWRSSEEIAQFLSTAKVLLQTSNFEGMSVAVMEALASGCMVVSSRVSGVEDLEKDPLANEVVKLYETGDVVTGARLLANCLEGYQSKLSVAAVKLAKKHYSIAGCTENYLEFSKELHPGKLKYSIPSPVTQAAKSFILGNTRYIKWKLKGAKQ